MLYCTSIKAAVDEPPGRTGGGAQNSMAIQHGRVWDVRSDRSESSVRSVPCELLHLLSGWQSIMGGNDNQGVGSSPMLILWSDRVDLAMIGSSGILGVDVYIMDAL